MKRAEYEKRIDDIVKRLNELSEKDRIIVQPRSSTPVTISLEELHSYGERYEERQKLHEDLRQLANVKIDD